MWTVIVIDSGSSGKQRSNRISIGESQHLRGG
jgi:hypothetical protein